MANGDDLKERLTQRISRGQPAAAAAGNAYEITAQLVQAEDARRRAEDQLAKALNWVRFLRERKLDQSQISADAAEASRSLKADLQTSREGLDQSERALRQARDRTQELETAVGRERAARQELETELQATRKRLQEASVLLADIEKAYVSGQTQRIELR